MEEGEEGTTAPVIPTMYRWISTSRVPVTRGGLQDPQGPRMVLSFSVPIRALPPASAAKDVLMRDSVGVVPSSLPVAKPLCDFKGCEAQRKYRLVKDWQRGACGLPHLKALETQRLST